MGILVEEGRAFLGYKDDSRGVHSLLSSFLNDCGRVWPRCYNFFTRGRIECYVFARIFLAHSFVSHTIPPLFFQLIIHPCIIFLNWHSKVSVVVRKSDNISRHILSVCNCLCSFRTLVCHCYTLLLIVLPTRYCRLKPEQL